jgi:hypothetical protein
MQRFSFKATLVRFEGPYGVDAPVAVSRAIGRAAMPVTVRVNRGAPFHATLMPAGGGRHRLFFGADVRRGAGIEPGDRVAVDLVADPALRGREVPIPPDLREALGDEGAGVLDAWESLPPGKREHILRWIEQAVHEATRAKRVARAVEEALARRERRIDRGM